MSWKICPFLLHESSSSTHQFYTYSTNAKIHFGVFDKKKEKKFTIHFLKKKNRGRRRRFFFFVAYFYVKKEIPTLLLLLCFRSPMGWIFPRFPHGRSLLKNDDENEIYAIIF